jgi:hypothetical protein
MNKSDYKHMRINEIGEDYRKHSTSKTEWDKIIAMECGDYPEKRGNTTGYKAVQMLLECKYTEQEIENQLSELFPNKKNTGRAKRMARIFAKDKCKNVTVYKYNGILGLKWNRYQIFDENGNYKEG